MYTKWENKEIFNHWILISIISYDVFNIVYIMIKYSGHSNKTVTVTSYYYVRKPKQNEIEYHYAWSKCL